MLKSVFTGLENRALTPFSDTQTRQRILECILVFILLDLGLPCSVIWLLQNDI